MPPKKVPANSKAEAARERKETAEAEKKALAEKQKEDAVWAAAEGTKSKAQLKKQEEAAKKAETAAKKAEAKALADQEAKELENYGKRAPTKKAPSPIKKVTAAELALQQERLRKQQVAEAEELAKARARTVHEEEYESIVLQPNINREEELVEARSVDAALSALSVSGAAEATPDKHPEKRIKAAYKSFEEAELARLRAERPGMTLSQYKDQVWKTWKKSPIRVPKLLTGFRTAAFGTSLLHREGGRSSSGAGGGAGPRGGGGENGGAGTGGEPCGMSCAVSCAVWTKTVQKAQGVEGGDDKDEAAHAPPPLPLLPVTCLATLLTPSLSLWTGGDDGRVVRWQRVRDELIPTSVHCGHLGPIAWLIGCEEALPSSIGNLSPNGSAVVSGGSNGMLCVWEGASGRCRKRRRLPNSLGTPLLAALMPATPRHICIACTGAQEESMATGIIVLLVEVASAVVVSTYSASSEHPSARPCALSCSKANSIMLVTTNRHLLTWTSNSVALTTTGSVVDVWADRGLVLVLDESAWQVVSAADGHMLYRGDVGLWVRGQFLRSSALETTLELVLCGVDGSIQLFATDLDLLSGPASPSVTTCTSYSNPTSQPLHLAQAGQWLASATATNQLMVWNINSNWQGVDTFVPHLKGAWQAASEHDDPVTVSLIVGGDNISPAKVARGHASGLIGMYSLMTGSSRLGEGSWVLLGHTRAVLCLAEHRSVGKRSLLLSGSADWSVRVWDSTSAGEALAVLLHHSGPVKSLLLPPAGTHQPWATCFMSIGEDGTVGLVALSTLQCERLLPGHPSAPEMCSWDSIRGYLACMCEPQRSNAALYIWDLHSGVRDRVVYGGDARSLFAHFRRRCGSSGRGFVGGSVSSDMRFERPDHSSTSSAALSGQGAGGLLGPFSPATDGDTPASQGGTDGTLAVVGVPGMTRPIRGLCPLPGLAAVICDVLLLLEPGMLSAKVAQERRSSLEKLLPSTIKRTSLDVPVSSPHSHNSKADSAEGRALRMALSMLHVWGLSPTLDERLQRDVHLIQPSSVTSGLIGDDGAMTFLLPCETNTTQLWRDSGEFTAQHTLAIVALAKRMMSLSEAACNACSALVAYYAVGLLADLPDMAPPWLEVYASSWQHPCQPLREAARALFRAAAAHSLPSQLVSGKLTDFLLWLEWPHGQPDWADAHPTDMKESALRSSTVQREVPALVLPLLLRLMRSGQSQGLHSAAAADILAEGMDTTWQPLIKDLSGLMLEVSAMVEHLGGARGAIADGGGDMLIDPTRAMVRRESLATLLEAMAAADVPTYLAAVRLQLETAPSDSAVHTNALMTMFRLTQGNPAVIVPHLPTLVATVMRTLDPSMQVLRRTCLQTATALIYQMVAKFPMLALHKGSMRLAVGDAISVSPVHVYDLQSSMHIRILQQETDTGSKEVGDTVAALLFAPDGESLVAYTTDRHLHLWQLSAGWRMFTRGPISVPFQRSVPVQLTDRIEASPSASRTIYALRFRLEWTKQGAVQLFYQDRPVALTSI
eukprot:jgi/Chlat1/7062/Chrsp56S06723